MNNLNSNKYLPKRTFCIVAFLLLFCISSSLVDGQSPFKNGEHNKDRNLRSTSRVNPSTLAMEFSLPLGAYAGRSGNSTPITISYSSKIWHTKSLYPKEVEQYNGPGSPTYIFTTSYNNIARFSKRSSAGWTSSLQRPAIIKDIEIYGPDGTFWPTYEPPDEGSVIGFTGDCSNPDNWQCDMFTEYNPDCLPSRLELMGECSCSNLTTLEVFTVIRSFGCAYGTGSGAPSPLPGSPNIVPIQHIVPRLRIAMPDGSSVEFRKEDRAINCDTNPSSCNGYQDGEYLSVNASGLRLKVGDTTINPSDPNERHAVLYMPDGGRYVFPDLQASTSTALYLQASYFFDINGNRTVYSEDPNETVDTIGRTLTDPLPNILNQELPVVGSENVTLPGQSSPYVFNWKRLRNVSNPSDTVLEDTSKELGYIGSDTCESVINDNPLSPALFSLPTDVTTGSGNPSYPNTQYRFKERMCAINAPSVDGTPPSSAPQKFNPVVLHEVALPNGTAYQFRYNEFGEITKITHPSGAVERFRYDKVPPIASIDNDQTNRGVVERWLISDGVTQHWTYSSTAVYGSGGHTMEVTTTSPDGSSTKEILDNTISGSTFGFSNPLSGLPKESRVYGTDDRWVARRLTKYTTEPSRDTSTSYTRDVRPTASVSIQFEKQSDGSYLALATMSETAFDTNSDASYFAHLNPEEVTKYHFLVVGENDAKTKDVDWFINKFHTEGSISEKAQTDYSYDANYKDRGITSRPIETRVIDPANANNILAKTQTVYDESQYLVGDSGALTGNAAATWVNPNTMVRGLVTTQRVWNSDTNSWIETHMQYDQYGNARKAWDAVGNMTETQYSATYACAYPTSVTTPAPDPTNTTGTSQTSTVSTTYDLNTGLPLTVTDDFGQTTATEYNDPLLRPTRAYAVNFTAPESQTIYGDTPGNLFVKVRKQLDATNWDEATTFMDGLGRTVKTQAKDSQGDVFMLTCYDSMGRLSKVTNPFRGFTAQNCATTTGLEWTTTDYDELGRVKFVTTPDIARVETQYGLATTGTEIGTTTTVIDQALKQRRSITNALGQLIRVDEPNLNNELGSVSSPNQATRYFYNSLGKMTRVQQGVQNRYFMYDSLGRMIRVKQPEQEVNTALNTTGNPENNSWSAAFTYDVLGNVLTSTDAKGTVITNTYDRSNRVTTRTYSNEPVGVTTPAVSFFYDGKGLAQQQSPNYAKGKLTKVTSSVSETQYSLFDNFGRITESKQITDGNTYTSSYQYSLSGALTQETYPSGRVVKNEFETDGDLAKVTSQKAGGSVYTPYASNISYSAAGAVTSMRLGNGNWETASFNSRLQPVQLGLGASIADTGLWKVNYEYGELQTNGTIDVVKNNGNIAKQTLTIPGTSFVQAYKYDPLNRLAEAKETTSTTQNWIQNWTYDLYGNRLTFTQNIAGNTSATNPSVDANTNRFVTGQGFVYDKNGNVINDVDAATGHSRRFVFNGDNKQTQVKDVTNNNHLVGTYHYDGEGKRVKKVTDSETTIFVYSLGRIVAEYSTQLSQTPSVNYTTTDHLGSPRIITDQLGQVKSRRDFLPFGEDIFGNVGARTPALKYGTSGDDVRQKFTGYQKDGETSLDFAEARMYENRLGRFTVIDPLLTSAKPTNPQSFNRYVYVLNNPLKLVDPNGLKPVYISKKLENGDIEYIFLDDKSEDYKKFTKDGYKLYRPKKNESFLGTDDHIYQFTKKGFNDLGPAGNASATVYMWEGSKSGHLAVEFMLGDKRIYISFYPKDGGPRASAPGTWYDDYEGRLRTKNQDEETTTEDDKPKVFSVDKVDWKAVSNYFTSLNQDPGKWTFGRNCSDIVAEALEAGGLQIKNTQSSNSTVSGTFDIIKTGVAQPRAYNQGVNWKTNWSNGNWIPNRK